MGDLLPPVDLGAGRTATAITAGDGHTCVLLDDGAVKCWGYNAVGQLGYDQTPDLSGSTSPRWPARSTSAPGERRPRSPPAMTHTCALLDNDTVKCWGFNKMGELGYGDTEHRGDGPGEMGDNLAPVSVDNSLSVVPVDAAPAPPSGLSAARPVCGRDVGVVGTR